MDPIYELIQVPTHVNGIIILIPHVRKISPGLPVNNPFIIPPWHAHMLVPAPHTAIMFPGAILLPGVMPSSSRPKEVEKSGIDHPPSASAGPCAANNTHVRSGPGDDLQVCDGTGHPPSAGAGPFAANNTQVRSGPGDDLQVCDGTAPLINTLEKDRDPSLSGGASTSGDSCTEERSGPGEDLGTATIGSGNDVVAPPLNTLDLDRFDGAQFCIPTHDEIMNGLKKFSCEVCSWEFCRANNLEMHKRSHGSQYRKGPGSLRGKQPTLKLPFYCCAERCCRNIDHPQSMPLKNFRTLQAHYHRKHCEKQYACGKCNLKKFSVKADCQTHVKNCGKLWWCKCGSDYKYKRSLTDHINTKEKEGQGEHHGVDTLRAFSLPPCQ